MNARDDDLDVLLRARAHAAIEELSRTGPRRQGFADSHRSWRPMAAAVGVALTVGAAGYVLATRAHSGPNATNPAVRTTPLPVQTPGATASPSAIRPSTPLQSTVPAGVQVVYHWSRADVAPGSSGGRDGSGSTDPGEPPSGSTVMHAVDWTGHEVGRITIPGSGAGVVQSPDGEELYVAPNVFGSDGHWIGLLPGDPGGRNTFGPLWADDSRHLCKVTMPLTSASTPAELIEYTPNQPERVVTRLSGPQSLSWGLLACSETQDRAVLHGVIEAPGGLSLDRLVIVRLSDGHEITQRDYCNSASTCAAGAAPALDGASPDGMLLMERTADGVVAVDDLRTGKVTSTGVRGGGDQLSSDGSSILITLESTAGTSGPPATVPGLVMVDVRSSRILWRAPNAGTINGFTLALPGGGDIAVAAGDYHPNSGVFPSGSVTLYLVAPSGRVVTVARGIERIPAA